LNIPKNLDSYRSQVSSQLQLKMSHSLSVSINREKSQETEKKNPLKPGDHFPRVVLHSNCGEDLNLQVSRSRARLIVFFRGSFCNFCEEALLEINCRMDTFERENIDVVAVSADTVQESKDLSTRLGLRFPIACDLTVDQMRTLGLYIHTSDPATSPSHAYCSSRRRVPTSEGAEECKQMWRRPFCEPAHFFLRPDNTIKSMDTPDALYYL